MFTHPLAKLAWKVNDLLRGGGARQRLRSKCLEHFDQDEPAPAPTLNSPATLAAKCALLVALHSEVCKSAEGVWTNEDFGASNDFANEPSSWQEGVRVRWLRGLRW